MILTLALVGIFCGAVLCFVGYVGRQIFPKISEGVGFDHPIAEMARDRILDAKDETERALRVVQATEVEMGRPGAKIIRLIALLLIITGAILISSSLAILIFSNLNLI